MTRAKPGAIDREIIADIARGLDCTSREAIEYAIGSVRVPTCPDCPHPAADHYYGCSARGCECPRVPGDMP